MWDQEKIARGLSLLEAALPSGTVGPFQLQAAIAAVHATAETLQSTDWAQIHEPLPDAAHRGTRSRR